MHRKETHPEYRRNPAAVYLRMGDSTEEEEAVPDWEVMMCL